MRIWPEDPALRTITSGTGSTEAAATRLNGFTHAAWRRTGICVVAPVARKNKMTSNGSVFSPLYEQGVAYFNECEFFEAHEAWEELWTEYRGPARRFYQGMIQVAVALHHFGNGNLGGAKKVYATSRSYLDEYRPSYEGVDLDAFLGQYERCFAALLDCEQAQPEIEIDADLIPEIHLDPDLATSHE